MHVNDFPAVLRIYQLHPGPVSIAWMNRLFDGIVRHVEHICSTQASKCSETGAHNVTVWYPPTINGTSGWDAA